MQIHPFRVRAHGLLADAGVAVAGCRGAELSDCDLPVHDDRLHARLLSQGSRGLGAACTRKSSWGPGLFLLHTIASNVSVNRADPWIARYIFPNSKLPAAAQIAVACEGRFVIEDGHGFGTDYDRMLQAWRDNIERAWPTLPPRYDDRLRRMWRFYLAASMTTFRTRRSQLWQEVMSLRGVAGG